MNHRERRGGFVLACIAACLLAAAVGWLFGLALYDEAANWRRLLMEVWMGFSFGDELRPNLGKRPTVLRRSSLHFQLCTRRPLNRCPQALVFGFEPFNLFDVLVWPLRHWENPENSLGEFPLPTENKPASSCPSLAKSMAGKRKGRQAVVAYMRTSSAANEGQKAHAVTRHSMCCTMV